MCLVLFLVFIGFIFSSALFSPSFSVIAEGGGSAKSKYISAKYISYALWRSTQLGVLGCACGYGSYHFRKNNIAPGTFTFFRHNVDWIFETSLGTAIEGSIVTPILSEVYVANTSILS